MDPSIFDIDLPLVLLDEIEVLSVWDKQSPAPLLMAALAGAGVSVMQCAGDPALGLLAALLGSDVTVVPRDSRDIRGMARVNGVQLTLAAESSGTADVLITVVPPSGTEARVILIPSGRSSPEPGWVRLDLHDGAVLVEDPTDSDAAHLLVREDQVTAVSLRLQEAADAFQRRKTNAWAERALRGATAAAGEWKRQRLRDQAEAAQEVARAHDQMRHAQEQLRQVRLSRSWRYTRILRRVTDK